MTLSSDPSSNSEENPDVHDATSTEPPPDLDWLKFDPVMRETSWELIDRLIQPEED